MIEKKFKCKNCGSIYDARYWNESYASQINDDFVPIEEDYSEYWYCPHCSWRNEQAVKVEPVHQESKEVLT